MEKGCGYHKEGNGKEKSDWEKQKGKEERKKKGGIRVLVAQTREWRKEKGRGTGNQTRNHNITVNGGVQ